MQQRLLTVSAVRACDATGEPSAPLVPDDSDAPDFAAGLGAFFRPLCSAGFQLHDPGLFDCLLWVAGDELMTEGSDFPSATEYSRSDNPGLHFQLEFLLLVADY